MVGQPYGSIFQIGDRELIKIDDNNNSFEILLNDIEGGNGDNSAFEDSNTAQKLTLDEIGKLKEVWVNPFIFFNINKMTHF